MPLANTKYESSNEELEINRPLIPDTTYNPSEEEDKLQHSVLNRYMRMRSKRAGKDKFWQGYYDQYISRYIPYADGSTRVLYPLERSIVELFVSETIGLKSDYELLPIGQSDVNKCEVMKEVWENNRTKELIDEEEKKNEYSCAIFGTSAYLTEFSQEIRYINDPVIDDNEEITFVEKMKKEGRIIIKNVDIRNVYFDDRVTSFKDCNDQIYIEYITPEMLRTLEANTNFKNIDKVGTTSKVDQVYLTLEDRYTQQGEVVELMHYWNKLDDKYVVLANRQIVIREQPIMYAHKELPIVPRQCMFDPDSIYGIGYPETLKTFKAQLCNIAESIADGIFRSNNSAFMVWPGVEIDGEEISFNNTQLRFQWVLNDANFRELRGAAPNQQAFNRMNDLIREIATFVGIDVSAITWQAATTAFESAKRLETSIKRVKTVLMNKDDALQMVYSRHLKNLMQFYPLSQVRDLLEILPSGKIKEGWKKTFPTIMLKGKKPVTNPDKTVSLVAKEGDYPFEVKPEYIRGQMDIQVRTNFNKPTLQQLQKDNMIAFQQGVQIYLQNVQMSPELAKIMPAEQYLKDMAEKFDVDIESIGGYAGSITKEADALREKINQAFGATEPQMMGQWQPAPAPNAGATPSWMVQPTPNPTNILPNVGQTWLPPVSQPNMPSLANLKG